MFKTKLFQESDDTKQLHFWNSGVTLPQQLGGRLETLKEKEWASCRSPEKFKQWGAQVVQTMLATVCGEKPSRLCVFLRVLDLKAVTKSVDCLAPLATYFQHRPQWSVCFSHLLVWPHLRHLPYPRLYGQRVLCSKGGTS